MERRLWLIAAIVAAGIALAAALAVGTDACQDHLYARWRAQHESGPTVSLFAPCVPSYLAHEYGMLFAYAAGAVAAITALVAGAVSIAKVVLGSSRTARAREIVGRVNVGALIVVMVATAGVAGCGEGEVRVLSLPPVALGFVMSVLGACVGVGPAPRAAGQV
jgi:hypothetical protein